MQFVVITFDGAEDRQNKMRLQLEQQHLHGGSFVIGKTANDYPNFEKSFYFHTPQQKAIAENHFFAIANTSESTWILEDDIVLCENFLSQYDTFLEKVPTDWDILYLGFAPIDPHSHFTIKDGYAELHFDCMGAWAYCIRGEARKKYAEMLPNMASDIALEALQRTYKSYSAYPFIATVSDGFSYNSQMDMHWPTIQNHFIDNLKQP